MDGYGKRIRPVSYERKDGGLLFHFSDGSSTFFPDLSYFYRNSSLASSDAAEPDKDKAEAA